MQVTLISVILIVIDYCLGEPVSSNLMDADQGFEVALYKSNILVEQNKTSSPLFYVSLSENNSMLISSNFSEAPVIDILFISFSFQGISINMIKTFYIKVDYFSIAIRIRIATNFSIKISGIISEWYFDIKFNCSNPYILRKNSSYIQCLSTSR